MGYTKVYDKLFIKVYDEKASKELYMPVCLHGASNCTEYINGREVLERSWDLFSYCDEMLMAEAEQLMKEVKARHEGGTCADNFQYKGRWLDDAAVIRFFESGIKNAVTIEEIRKQCGSWESIRAYLYCYSKNGNSHRLMEKELYTSEEIINWVQEAKQKKTELLNSGDYGSVYIGFGFYGREPKRITRHKDIDKPVVAKGKFGYISRIDERGWEYNRDPQKAIIFSNSDEAYSILPKSASFSLVSASNIKQKTWVLSVNRFGRRLIVDRLTSRHCDLAIYPENARRRFRTQEEAISYFDEKIAHRFPGLTSPEALQIAV